MRYSTDTIYDRHGIGDGALSGLLAAIDRIQASRRRLKVQPPAPLPAIGIPELPELPQIRGCGLTWNPAEQVVFTKSNPSSERASSVSPRTILETLSPQELVELTQAAEGVAARLEAEAEARAAEIERRVQVALEEADPAFQWLAERLSATEQAEREREAWIREHGSVRLRRLLQEGIEHDAVYYDERLGKERPGWCYMNRAPGRHEEPRNPPETALDFLDKVRETVPDARLLYWIAPRDCKACREGNCPDHASHNVRGYTCWASFLDRDIVYLGTSKSMPPLVIEEEKEDED